MRLLIFGCGYLGLRVANTCVQTGNTVYAVTRSPQTVDSLRKQGIEPLLGDICDPASLRSLPAVDVVLHAVGYDRNSARTKRQVTCEGLQNALGAMRGRYAHWVYTSSTSVYGQMGGEWVDENSVCDPLNESGRIMLDAETLIRAHHAESTATHFTILRLAGLYGPGRLLTRIESLRNGVPIAGRADSWLNLVHVDDAAIAVTTCMAIPLPSNTYLVTDDRPVQRQEFYGRLASLIGAPRPVFDDALPAARGSGGLNKRCSNRQFKKQSGWLPIYSSIDSGLPAAVGSLATNA